MREEQIGDCRLICADMREVMPGLSADHVITDPPFEAEAHTLQCRVKRGGEMSSEQLPFAPITDRDGVAADIARASSGWAVVFCQAEAVQAWRLSLETAGAKYKRAMVWVGDTAFSPSTRMMALPAQLRIRLPSPESSCQS
jgi:site-specific DNA-methyltransferase (adenine-specific)